jgi:Fe2+ transport system protein FeoA
MDELDVHELEPRLAERAAVERWRAKRLIALGFGYGEARRLALSDVDVHELERLIEMGCPPGTAVRIAA